MAKDPAVLAHLEWLGYVQPTGLVVSIPALLEATAFLNRNSGPDHRRFLDALPTNGDDQPVPEIQDFPHFAQSVFGWAPEDLWGAPGAPALPNNLEAPLPDYGETLRPDLALREFQPKDSQSEWILLVRELPADTGLDTVHTDESHHWQASPQTRFERLLRETRVPTGLLVNGREIRLVYAPRGEASGHITFRVADMVQVAGRSIFAGLHMLLCQERLYSVGENQRLNAILANSRKYQNMVSTQLAGQVLDALYELLRGFQAADDQQHGDLLRDVLGRDPNQVYGGLLTTLLRLVFVLYAEDRGLISTDPVYVNHYSITGLYERLRSDAGRFPDTMDQRYGAWAQLLALFRLIYRGGKHGGMNIPAREGYLFDRERYPFLEGRHGPGDAPEIPQVSDGVIFRVLSKLLVLDGERLSYRTLAVEQIGSVYEAVMGFTLEVAKGASIAIKPAKSHGAPAAVNLDELLRVEPGKRQAWFAERTDQRLTGQAADALKSATTVDGLLAALEKKIARSVTPAVVPKGAMIFQPSNERRRSGSHYTPSTLTGPIVGAALRPILDGLGERPIPDQLLELKVCDPAMGSGAFLVEACRQLGERLVEAWHAHEETPVVPPDEDELLLAMRTVAQRCLYGVDKNPMATDLAKLSLWLATLAKDHPFTFLDHALRTGDSLVGCDVKQISYFRWETQGQQNLFGERFRKMLDLALRNRAVILEAPDYMPYETKRQQLILADQQLIDARMAGDALCAAFFAAGKPRERDRKRTEMGALVKQTLDNVTDLKTESQIRAEIDLLRDKGVKPFHWELRFPEVFRRGGFDVIVGNPPFAGKNTLADGHAEGYLDWLKLLHEGSHGNSDLVAHFFRRAFTLLRPGGCFGLIATNTIGQGDTRTTGLRWICNHGGTIYQARKRLKWPGQAAVVVSVIHVAKGEIEGPRQLDGRAVDLITAYLFHTGGNEEPLALMANENKSFQGSIIMGMGFTFDDSDKKGVASPLSVMRRLIEKDPHNERVILPFLGWAEVAENPTPACNRYVISFADLPLRRKTTGESWFQLTAEGQRNQLREGVVAPDYPDPVAADWPDLLSIVEERVKPERDKQAGNPDAIRRKKFWWLWERHRPSLYSAVKGLERVIVAGSQASTHYAFAFLPTGIIYSSNLSVIAADTWAALCTLQSRVHEVWARFFMSTMKDDLAYTPTTCFEPFPFSEHWATDPSLERAGKAYSEFRTALMTASCAGLTRIYNRFHDPGEMSGDITELRRMHNAIDRVVLDSYGWSDIQPHCEFIPEHYDEADDGEAGRSGRKKYRYRWPDETRDEVLARLLELNRKRASEEGQRLPATPESGPPGAIARQHEGKKRASNEQSTQGLLALEDERQ